MWENNPAYETIRGPRLSKRMPQALRLGPHAPGDSTQTPSFLPSGDSCSHSVAGLPTLPSALSTLSS